jgi:hypothetical protein
MHVNAKVGLAIALVITIIIVIALLVLVTRGPTEQVIVSPSILQPSPYDLPYIPPPIPYGFTYDDFPSSGENDYSLTPEQDLRSADSDFGSSYSYDDQFSSMPEQDLRSADSLDFGSSYSYDDQFSSMPAEDLRSMDSFDSFD